MGWRYLDQSFELSVENLRIRYLENCIISYVEMNHQSGLAMRQDAHVRKNDNKSGRRV